jgi:hypothetical protein
MAASFSVSLKGEREFHGVVGKLSLFIELTMTHRGKFPDPEKQESATLIGKMASDLQFVQLALIQVFPFAVERSRLGWDPFRNQLP